MKSEYLVNWTNAVSGFGYCAILVQDVSVGDLG